MPSFTGKEVSGDAPAKGPSGTPKWSPKFARRPARGNGDKANALPTVPQKDKSSRSGRLMGYQNRPTQFAIDS